MRTPALTFVAIMATATLVIGYLLQQLREERSSAAQLQQRVAQLTRDARPAGLNGLGQSPQDQAPAATTPGVSDAPPSVSTLDTNSSPAGPRPLFSSAIAKELGLTVEEAEAFTRLLRNNGSHADFVALIGASKYEQYQQSQRKASREQRLDRLRTSLAGSDHPLTDAQAAQLDVLLDAEQRRRAAAEQSGLKPTDPRALLNFDEALVKATQAATDRMVANARGFLSVQQAALLQSELSGSVSQQLDNLRARRARLDAGGN